MERYSLACHVFRIFACKEDTYRAYIVLWIGKMAKRYAPSATIGSTLMPYRVSSSSLAVKSLDSVLPVRKEPWMDGFDNSGAEVVNLNIFRHYVENYLRHHPKVNSDMIMTVRQLQPTSCGLPVELYFFSADTAWLKYEDLQAEVFEHILAMLHKFNLKAFQSPSGMDFHK